MLAYTTVSDLFDLPSAFEAIGYIGGLLLVMACPYLFLWLVDLRRRARNKQTTPDTQTQP